MAKLKTLSSLTDKSLAKFDKDAKQWDKLSCTRIVGFFAYKNAKSIAFKLRLQTQKTSITIGLAHKITTYEAAEIALEMIERNNNGGDPKDILRKPSKTKTTRSIPVPADDLSYLGNFFQKVYQPHVLKEEWGSAKNAIALIEYEFGHLFRKKMSELSVQDIEDWQDSIEQRTCNGRPLVYDTIKRKYDTLLGLIRYAVEVSNKPNGPYAGLLYESPFKIRALRGASMAQKSEYENRRKEIDKLNRRILEESELISLELALTEFNAQTAEARTRSRQHTARKHLPDLSKQHFAHWILPFIYMCYYTGLRPNDILDLRWEDFYNDKFTITANKSKRYNEPVIIQQNISDSKRIFKYSCKEVLALWSEDCGAPTTGWVFPSDNDKTKRLGRDGYKASWKTIQKLAGIKLHVYSFRHHFISYLLSIRTDKLAVAHLVGHKSTRMIDEHYSHHLPSNASDALNQL